MIEYVHPQPNNKRKGDTADDDTSDDGHLDMKKRSVSAGLA